MTVGFMVAAVALPAGVLFTAPPGVGMGGSALSDQACLGCHGGRSAHTPGGAAVQAVVAESAHGGLQCVDCHQGISALPHRARLVAVECSRCHYVEPLPAATGKPAAMGLHQRIREKDVRGAPACRDCHGAHNIKPPEQGDSTLGRAHITGTCGACHPKAARSFAASVHGKALAAGNRDVPDCAVCHPEHPGGERKGMAGIRRGGVVATCTACHEDPGLQRRYALPAGRLASYLGSYHGAAAELGASRTANCASCHGAHLILPSADPRSTTNAANIPRTCGRCHPGAGGNFALGTIHLRPSLARDRLVFAVRAAYQVFIALLMLSFVGYIGLDLRARWRERSRGARPRPRAEEEPQFERLTLNQRLQHWLLIGSFAALIVTGFPLLYPRSTLSRGVVTLLGGVGARAVVHRAAALALIALVAYHLLYVLSSARGSRESRELMPRRRDALDLAQMLGFYFGLTPVRPRFGRYNYIEKFEYLAVGWGSVIMISSGALLWSPSVSLEVLPKWALDIAAVVHSWEAIMAFLAIIIWHLYNVHWSSATFPMSRIWLTGKVGLRELRENHPLEYERMDREG